MQKYKKSETISKSIQHDISKHRKNVPIAKNEKVKLLRNTASVELVSFVHLRNPGGSPNRKRKGAEGKKYKKKENGGEQEKCEE